MKVPASISEAKARLQSGEISSLELVEAVLDRIAATNERLAAFVTVTADIARVRAVALDKERAAGGVLGPLHGIPYGVKDIIATKGVRTTAHSRFLLSNVPQEDAASVARLTDAGAILVGKLASHEFGFGGPADDLPFPAARNPWNTDRVPGGSSSGPAVAVSAGLCLGALASDSGGSIRAPAAYCGVVGLKPTFGRISCTGVIGLSSSLDTLGVMTRTVADSALLFHVLVSPQVHNVTHLEPVARTSGSLQDLSIGVLSNLQSVMPGLTEAQAQAFDTAVRTLEDLGAKIVAVKIPDLARTLAASRAILFFEAFMAHRERLRACPNGYSRITRDRLTMGLFVNPADYKKAKDLQPQLAGKFEAIFDRIDALALPATEGVAGRFGDRDFSTFLKGVDVSNAFNVTGHPYMVLPCGMSEGLPLGLQLVARCSDEATLFAVGAAYEARAGWNLSPPL